MPDKKLIKILDNIAILLEIKGENPFKSRAYSNAAEIIRENQLDIQKEVQEGTLSNIKGFGDALVKKMTEYVQIGKISYYEKLIAEIPESLVDITKINSMGPRKTKLVYEQLGVKSINELEEVCLNGSLKKLKGFTDKSIEIILNSIAHKKASKGLFLQNSVIEYAENLLNQLKSNSQILDAEISGSYRRFAETITDLHIVVSTYNPFEMCQDFKSTFNANQIEKHLLILTNENIPVTVDFAKPDEYILKLHQSTGSDEYTSAFIQLFKEINSSFSFTSEEELYNSLGIQFVPPELRESITALEKAKQFKIPRLIENLDLKGMLHVHSNWSDGRNSILEMALRAKELGFSYIAMCDHSRSAGYTNGLSIERVKLQHEEIDKLNEENHGIKILKGIESDILTDGSLDYPEDVLEKFDIVVVSVHSSFNMSKSQMTKRMIAALASPYTTILGHPTGRLLTSRLPYEVDINEIIDAAADYGKIIEINANPYRLDLSWENVIYAKEKEVRIAINPDSHKTSTLEDVFIGVKVARKGWLEAKDVVNCLDYENFMNGIVNGRISRGNS
ncbi:MAG: DNA polymerase/3'-5' exonuclease PolX [Bacteroidetes bacterium]|nr:MAG: DNA polymerase/3'-5' exonuclease PolX [Bacteroidota bacterium]